ATSGDTTTAGRAGCPAGQDARRLMARDDEQGDEDAGHDPADDAEHGARTLQPPHGHPQPPFCATPRSARSGASAHVGATSTSRSPDATAVATSPGRRNSELNGRSISAGPVTRPEPGTTSRPSTTSASTHSPPT